MSLYEDIMFLQSLTEKDVEDFFCEFDVVCGSSIALARCVFSQLCISDLFFAWIWCYSARCLWICAADRGWDDPGLDPESLREVKEAVNPSQDSQDNPGDHRNLGEDDVDDDVKSCARVDLQDGQGPDQEEEDEDVMVGTPELFKET